MPSTVKSFSFNPNEYPELARWLETIGKERGRLAREVTEILNAHVTGERRPILTTASSSPDYTRIQAQLDRIEALLESGQVVVNHETASDVELPADVLSNLDQLVL